VAGTLKFLPGPHQDFSSRRGHVGSAHIRHQNGDGEIGDSWPKPGYNGKSATPQSPRATISRLNAHRSSIDPRPRKQNHVHQCCGLQYFERGDDILRAP